MSQSSSHRETGPLRPWLGAPFRVRTARAILEELSERDAREEPWCFADGERPPQQGDVPRGGRSRRPR